MSHLPRLYCYPWEKASQLLTGMHFHMKGGELQARHLFQATWAMFHKRPALGEPYWAICPQQKLKKQIPIDAKLQNICLPNPEALTFSGFVFAGGTTLASLDQVQASPQHRAPGVGFPATSGQGRPQLPWRLHVLGKGPGAIDNGQKMSMIM